MDTIGAILIALNACLLTLFVMESEREVKGYSDVFLVILTLVAVSGSFVVTIQNILNIL